MRYEILIIAILTIYNLIYRVLIFKSCYIDVDVMIQLNNFKLLLYIIHQTLRIFNINKIIKFCR